MPKVDLIALPQFFSSTYAFGNVYGVSRTTSHELAHNIFGNLVIIQWWDMISQFPECKFSARSKATARPDVEGSQLGQEFLQRPVPLEGGRGVTVMEPTVRRVDRALDGLGYDGVEVDGFVRGFGHFEYERPVGSFIFRGGICRLPIGASQGSQPHAVGRFIVRGEIGEDRGTVEGRVVFGEVEPAFLVGAVLVTPADPDPDDVGGRERQRPARLDQIRIADGGDQLVDRHRRNEHLVLHGRPVPEDHPLPPGVDPDHLRVEPEPLPRDRPGHGLPDASRSSAGGEPELRVRTPIPGDFIFHHVGADQLEVRGGNAFTQPFAK
ncbi:unnamed protein product, partial [Darwinula stevensoni]